MDTLPQWFASLPNELIIVVFDNILKITDKRQFLKTCITYNNLTKQSFANFENDNGIMYYDKLIYNSKNNRHYYNAEYLKFKKNYINKYCMEKFTIELCCDGYDELLPEIYFNKNNSIIIK